MHTKTSAMAAGLLVLFGLTAAVSAVPVKEFVGTRADVRAFCGDTGGFLLEGASYSLCIAQTSDVVCRDDGVCTSSDLELAFAAGFRTSVVTDVAINN